jgi:hypothetical protein
MCRMNNTQDNFISKNCELVEGTNHDYEILARYHYQPVIKNPLTKVFKLIGTGRYRDIYPDPLSVIAYMQPVPDMGARNKATAGYFNQFKPFSEKLKILNQHVLYLSRLITDPRFLRKGLATKLVRESLERLSIPIVETFTPIDFTNSMYIKCGFEIYYTPAPLKFKRMINAFCMIGIKLTELTPPEVIDNRLSKLPSAMSDYIEKEIKKFLGGYRNAERFTPSPERTKYILSKVPPPEAYLIWFNPRSEQAKDIRSFIESTKTRGEGVLQP